MRGHTAGQVGRGGPAGMDGTSGEIAGLGASSGAVLYNAGGALGAAAALFWDAVNRRLGIGRSDPAAPLHVYRDTAGAIQSIVEAAAGATSQVARTLRIGGSELGRIAAYATNFAAAAGAIKAGGTEVRGGGAGGLSLVAADAVGDLRAYTGGADDAHLRLTIDEAGVFTAANFGKRAAVSGAATTTISLASLDGNRDKWYRITARLKNATAGDVNIRLRPNGLTSNLRGQLGQHQNATTVAADEAANTFLVTIRASTEAVIDVIFYAQTGFRRFYLGQAMNVTSGSFHAITVIGGTWNETVTNLTSLDIVCDTAGGIDVGSEAAIVVPGFFVGA